MVMDIKPILTTQKGATIRKRTFVEFTDDQGIKRKGVMKSNDGFTCKILVNSTTYVVSRKQIKFVKE